MNPEILLQNFTNIATGFTAIIALLMIWKQLKYQNQQLKYHSLSELHKDIIGPRMHDAFQFIYANTSSDLAVPKNEKELEKIELILNTYDLIAVKLAQGFLPEKETLETEWIVILRIWEKLNEFIKKERELRGNVFYKKHFELLVEKALDYQKNNYPHSNIVIFKRKYKS